MKHYTYRVLSHAHAYTPDQDRANLLLSIIMKTADIRWVWLNCKED